jgi:class 3 adenylate cyclase/tetratricopeptide (TPR) repeat protein
MSSLRAWLESIGLHQYAEVFEQNDLELDVLGDLSDDELKELGVSLGHRKRLQRSLRERSLPNNAVAPEPMDDRASAPQAERRNVTVMFCDLVGSTALADGMDPEAFRDLLGVYHDAAREPIGRYGGHIARYLGDGLLVFFGFPRAREDDAVRAVRSALEVVRAIQDLANDELQVRLGLATGIVVAGDIIGTDRYEEQTVLGDVPNLAARLQSCTEPNTVLIAESTYQLVKNTVIVEEQPLLSLKGIANPVQAYRVSGLSNTANRGRGVESHRLRRIVGRASELALIGNRWDLARRGSGQVALISADAGVGKSRLIRQIREDTEASTRTSITFYCSPYQSGTPFFPIADAISRGAGVTAHDSGQQITGKLQRLLDTLEYTERDGVALLCSILGVATLEALPTNPEERRRKTLTFLSELIVHFAQRDTSLIVVEDLHFADSSTIELISLVIHQLDQTPALLLLTFRPSFEPPWNALSYATSISMNNLTRDESRHLVKAVAGDKQLPPEVEDEIIARCDGIPLFVEELTKSVIETIDQANDRIAIPMTLRDTLAARLDALGRAKRVAQAASIIGREFSYRVLEGLVSGHTNLPEDLELLEAAELITRRGQIPEARYLFKHALVQEAAYESLLLADRRSRHLALGNQLMQRTNELAATPSVIALHFERGGELNRALEYRQVAGTEAAKANALVEAEEHFSKAIALLDDIGDASELGNRRAELLLLLGGVQMPLYGFPSKQVRSTYTECCALLQRSSDDFLRFDATWGLWLNRSIAGDFDESRDLMSELDDLAEKTDDRAHRLQAHHANWTTSYNLRGDIKSTFARTEQGIALYTIEKFGDHHWRYGGHDPGVCGYSNGSLSSYQLGYPDKAKILSRRGLELARDLKHLPSLGLSAIYAAILRQWVDEPAAILELQERSTAGRRLDWVTSKMV